MVSKSLPKLLAFIGLSFLLLLTLPETQAQLITTTPVRAPLAACAQTNDPNMQVSPHRTQRGPVVSVSYTLCPGYSNKLDLVVVDPTGMVWVNESHVMPVGRFTFPIDTWDLVPGKYKVHIISGNFIHTQRLIILP